MNIHWFFIFVSAFFSDNLTYCQPQYPPCLSELISKTAEQHKKNSCDGSDKPLRVEQYSYKDTLLYKLVFERKDICPDYVNSTVFYDANCQMRIQIRDGGLKYRHQVWPLWVNEKEIRFVKNIDWTIRSNHNNNSEEIIQLTVDEKGKALKKFYISLNVENLWIAGFHVNWETGASDKPEATAGNHTHCSAFVAAACGRMNIYILRPPEHGQILLANAQYDWLQTKDASKDGWTLLTGTNRKSVYVRAQQLANSGKVVVAIFKNPDASKPGHAALVMPKETDANTLEENGPSLIMAGKHNFNLISLKNGFKSHIAEWPEYGILFFVNNNTIL